VQTNSERDETGPINPSNKDRHETYSNTMSPPIQGRSGKNKKPGKVVPVAAAEKAVSPIPSSSPSPSSSSSSSANPSTTSAGASESEGIGMESEEEQGEEEEVYGLDGRVIDKSTRGPSLKKGSDREKIEDKRGAVRGHIQGDDVDMGKIPGNKRSEDVLKPGMSLRGGSRGVRKSPVYNLRYRRGRSS
jgi:hypothetical protein